MAVQNSSQFSQEARLIAALPTDVQQQVDTNNIGNYAFVPLSFIIWLFCHFFKYVFFITVARTRKIEIEVLNAHFDKVVLSNFWIICL